MLNENLVAFTEEELQKQESESQRNILQAKTLNERKPKVTEILCPKTGRELSLVACQNCPFKKEFIRGHKLGFKLAIIICNWEEATTKEQ